MKKIGILFGQERTFPAAFVERGRALAPAGIEFEFVKMGEVQQGKLSDYAVILDRISQDVPFYRAALKHAALKGTAVINNPFWWSAEDKLTANAMAEEIGVPVPKTVLLPSKDHPDDTSADSFTNLIYPLKWDEMFAHIGFPAFMKPNTGGGWKSVYKVHSPEELWSAYGETGQLNMLLQEAIDFDTYFRCYCIGGKHVRVMPYEPRNAFHERYVRDGRPIDIDLLKKLESYVLGLCEVLGYDFNTVELAVRDGVPYAIDFTNPAPDADVNSVGVENFEWVVEHAAKYAIERALNHVDGGDNLTWGTFMQRSTAAYGKQPVAAKPKVKAVAKTQKPKASAKPAEKKAPAAKVAAPKPAKVVAKTETKPAAKKAAVKKPAVKKAEPVAQVSDAPLSAKQAKANTKALLDSVGKAPKGKKDDLKKISGIGPKLEGILNDFGIVSFEQVAAMSNKEYELVDSLLTSFKGRGKRDDWSGQAKKLK